MNLDIPGLRFGHLTSHLFPGNIVLIQLCIIYNIWDNEYFNFDIFFSLADKLLNITSSTAASIMLLALVISMSISIGYIVDGLQHVFFEKRLYNRYKKNKEGIAKYIQTTEQLNIINNTLIDAVYFYYEFFTNLLIATLPSFYILYKIILYKIAIPLLVPNICHIWCLITNSSYCNISVVTMKFTALTFTLIFFVLHQYFIAWRIVKYMYKAYVRRELLLIRSFSGVYIE